MHTGNPSTGEVQGRTLGIPGLGRQRQVDPYGPLAGQPCLICEPRVSAKDLVSKITTKTTKKETKTSGCHLKNNQG